MQADPVVQIEHLSRQFGKMKALSDVGLTIQSGMVYGLVGSNGAGKSTLIKHILGLMRPQEGTVRVFGLDPVKNPVEVLSQIGYLSEDRDLPDWMKVEELLRYTEAFYPVWDRSYARELLDTFSLDPGKTVRSLSKGMRAQVGLIVAVAYRPKFLILDEPSTGLDAIVRKDILNAIIRAVADDGRTVLFSSHLLDEVEQMSDRLFMIDQGRLVLQGSVDEVRETHFLVHTRSGVQDPRIITTEPSGSFWKSLLSFRSDSPEAARTSLEKQGWEILQLRNATLQEIFVGRAGRATPVQPEISSIPVGEPIR